MTLDRYADAIDDRSPGRGEVVTAEVAVSDDVLVKLHLGPGGEIDPHEHADATNVFHVLEGEPTVVRDGDAEQLAAPAVVYTRAAWSTAPETRPTSARCSPRVSAHSPDGRRDISTRAGHTARGRQR